MSARVGVIMGSTSDWATLCHTAETLKRLGIEHEVKVVSAHRTPDLLFDYAGSAAERGLEVIIAGAGVPVQSSMLSGVDSLLSIVQMPAGIPTGTLAIGRAGAINAALLAAAILGNKYPETRAALEEYRAEQTRKVLERPDPSQPDPQEA